MSLSINTVHIGGNCTRDPQVRFLANEKAVCNFGIAVNRKWKDANGDMKEEVTFIDITAWGRTGELCGQYLAKGRPCYIQGRLHTESWDDKTSGQKRSKLVVVADSVQFLDSAKRDGASATADGASAPAEGATQTGQPEPKRPSRPAPAFGDEEPPF